MPTLSTLLGGTGAGRGFAVRLGCRPRLRFSAFQVLAQGGGQTVPAAIRGGLHSLFPWPDPWAIGSGRLRAKLAIWPAFPSRSPGCRSSVVVAQPLGKG